jgi:hypothetical protein
MLRTTTDDDDSAIHARHLDMLKEIAMSQFQLPAETAEAIARDVLLASARHSRSAEWLTGAMICAIRSHLEDAG